MCPEIPVVLGDDVEFLFFLEIAVDHFQICRGQLIPLSNDQAFILCILDIGSNLACDGGFADVADDPAVGKFDDPVPVHFRKLPVVGDDHDQLFLG